MSSSSQGWHTQRPLSVTPTEGFSPFFTYGTGVKQFTPLVPPSSCSDMFICNPILGWSRPSKFSPNKNCMERSFCNQATFLDQGGSPQRRGHLLHRLYVRGMSTSQRKKVVEAQQTQQQKKCQTGLPCGNSMEMVSQECKIYIHEALSKLYNPTCPVPYRGPGRHEEGGKWLGI